MIRLPTKPKKEARVRIGVKITPFQKVIVKDTFGVNQIRYTKAKTISRNIRTVISKKSQFYIGDWHIETIPVQWDKTNKILKYDIKLYKRYGVSRDLEEYIGSMELAGVLHGSEFVYSFKNKNHVRFTNKNGHSIAELFLLDRPLAHKKLSTWLAPNLDERPLKS